MLNIVKPILSKNGKFIPAIHGEPVCGLSSGILTRRQAIRHAMRVLRVIPGLEKEALRLKVKKGEKECGLLKKE